MDIPRKIGIGIVMIVPGFVFGGMVWALFGSWFAIIIFEILMALLYSSLISGWPMASIQRA